MIADAKYLSENEKAALLEIKQRVEREYPGCGFILFGSKARGFTEPDSDIDLLIITKRELEYKERNWISDAIFDVNLEFDTLFSFIAVDEKQWTSKLFGFLPIHVNIEREGVIV